VKKGRLDVKKGVWTVVKGGCVTAEWTNAKQGWPSVKGDLSGVTGVAGLKQKGWWTMRKNEKRGDITFYSTVSIHTLTVDYFPKRRGGLVFYIYTLT
jgi:hypothetical protein